MVWSGGVDGVLCPHATVFARVAGEPGTEPRLTVGIAMSDTILPEEIGRPAMVEKVAEGVRRAMDDAGITDPADVHYVQTKTPLLTMETIAEAKARGHDVDHRADARVDGHLQRHDGAGDRGRARRDRDADRRADLPRRVVVLVGGLVLVGRRARPGPDRGGRQRPRSVVATGPVTA